MSIEKTTKTQGSSLATMSSPVSLTDLHSEDPANEIDTISLEELKSEERETLQRRIIEKLVFLGYDCMDFVKGRTTYTKKELIEIYQHYEKDYLGLVNFK